LHYPIDREALKHKLRGKEINFPGKFIVGSATGRLFENVAIVTIPGTLHVEPAKSTSGVRAMLTVVRERSHSDNFSGIVFQGLTALGELFM
jgi:hypothetical protein